jgi:NADH-quinone oxidoreductase subunit M
MVPLSIVVWLSAAAGAIGLIAPSRRGRGVSLAGLVGLAGSLATLGLAISLIASFSSQKGLQDVTNVNWIPALGIHYSLGLDGLNLFLVGLTALLFAAAQLASNVRAVRQGIERERLYFLLLGLGESAVLGAFLAQDLALFVAFYDLMLVPFYFLIGIWGGRERVRATLKLVIYTLVGSLLMLAGAVATGVIASHEHNAPLNFSLAYLQHNRIPRGSQEWVFLFFAAAFLVKMPLFPFQGWLPDGYRAMPTEVVMVFSGVLSKVAAYGFLAIALPLFPQAAVHYQLLILILALISILYGATLAFSQTDARLIAGYSSISQMGFITLGIFSLNSKGAQGALLGMLNHGLVVAPLFFIIALLADRAGGSEDIREMGGIAFRAPVLATLFLIVALATLAIPGSANFVGEFLILLGVFNAKLPIAIIASVGVVLASVYALRFFISAMHNRVGEKVRSFELSKAEGAVLAPLVAVILLFAFYPQLALARSERSVEGALAGPRTALREPAKRPSGQPAAPVEEEAAAEGEGEAEGG